MAIHTKLAVALGAALLLSLGGCVDDGPQSALVNSGVALSVDFLGNSDVAGLRVSLDRVGCAHATFEPFSQTVDVSLEDMTLPDAPTYDDNPFAAESGHLFGDAFLWLAPGCYDVLIAPINSAGTLSEDCGDSAMARVEVSDNAVTEITMVMQCNGAPWGGLDVAGVLNHPPLIDLITYSPSKFVMMCEPATICAYASDPDGDPLEVVWSDGTIAHGLDGTVESCIEILSQEAGTEMISVTVYDLYPDDAGGWKHIEELVAPELSRDSAELPLHITYCDPNICCVIVEPPLPPDGEGCTLTQGYWKNHPEAWLIATDTELCGQTWMEILHDPPDHGDAWNILTHQWIAASLNVAAGASTTPEIDAALNSPFVAACVVEAADREAAIETAMTLDDYNNGYIGPGHCECCECDDDDDCVDDCEQPSD